MRPEVERQFTNKQQMQAADRRYLTSDLPQAALKQHQLISLGW
jgi:hypothetical protein